MPLALSNIALPYWILIAGVFGLMGGSFLNVVILRLPVRLSAEWKRDARFVLGIDEPMEPLPPGIVVEGSHCPLCKHALAPYDNVPLFSWLILRGRCRHCRSPISAQYPLVELLGAGLSAVVVWRLGPTWTALTGIGLTWMLIAVAGIDARTKLLPDRVTLTLLWSGLLVNTIHLFTSPGSAILGVVVGYASLWSLAHLYALVRGKIGMAYGDFKLLAALGAWLGLYSLLPIVLIASLTLMVASAFVAIGSKRLGASALPFGPFLAASGWICLIAGDRLLPLLSLV